MKDSSSRKRYEEKRKQEGRSFRQECKKTFAWLQFEQRFVDLLPPAPSAVLRKHMLRVYDYLRVLLCFQCSIFEISRLSRFFSCELGYQTL